MNACPCKVYNPEIDLTLNNKYLVQYKQRVIVLCPYWRVEFEG